MLCLIKRHSLTSITWLYRGLKYRPIEFTGFFEFSADKLPVLIIGATPRGFFCNGYKSTGASFLALFKSIYYSNAGKKTLQE